MNYRYKVKGVAEKAFILRGAHFRIGGTIDTVILDSELAFVKERCRLEKVVDMQEKVANPKPLSTNSSKNPKGERNELSKQESRTNNLTSKTKV